MSEIEVLSAVHGIAPRSAELLRLGTDFEKGRVSQDDFDDCLEQESSDWLDLQDAAGIDIQEDGKLWWPDHLRPIVKGSEGFAPDIDDAPVTRWFQDNRFYRKPTIVDRLQFKPDEFESTTLAHRTLCSNISLLTPDTFARLCDDQYTELPAARNVFQLYSELLFWLEHRGVKRVTFEDYSNGEISTNGANHALKEIETLSDWCPGLQFAIVNPNSKETAIPWRLSPHLGIQIPPRDLNDIAMQPEYRRPDFTNGEIWHQVIDTSTTATKVRSLYEAPKLLQQLGVGRIVLTHTVDLECLPLVYAQDKVKHLAEVAARVKEFL
jgi:hypothetical protein